MTLQITEQRKLTLSEATQLILFAVDKGWDNHGDSEWGYNYLQYATGRAIQQGDWDAVYEAFDNFEHIKSCDLTIWFEEPTNDESRRALYLEHAEDVLNAAVYSLASIISGENGSSLLPLLEDLDSDPEFYEPDPDYLRDLAIDAEAERRMEAGL